MSDGIEEMGDAVASLEAALTRHRQRQAEEERLTQALRAENEAMRRVHRAIAGRLDAAIASLQSVLGD